MKRLLLATMFCAATALSAFAQDAERLELSEISTFFNEMTTAQARFTQYNSDGSISTGQLYLKRPGRMRFEYDPPESALVVAGSRELVIVDPRSNEPPESYPLRRTPLWIILEQRVNLAQSDMVIAHRLDGEATHVTAQDPENPDYGTIELIFAPEPVGLQGWVITDGAGFQTRVELTPFERELSLSNRLFDVRAVRENNSR